MAHETYDPRYREGILHFNRRNFFEAHEVWEDLWHDVEGPGRRFYQGLIQVAVCLFHFGRGNTRGAKKLYHTSRGYLEAFGPQHLGLNVAQLLEAMTMCCAPLLANESDAPQVTLNPALIPQLHLAPSNDKRP